MKKFVRAFVSSAVAMTGAVVLTTAVAGVAPRAMANAPGNPGTPSAPVVLYQETFENGQATGAGSLPSLLFNYVGAPPGNMTYTGDNYYVGTTAANAQTAANSYCNGVIASYNSARPAGWCNNNATYWNYVRGYSTAVNSLQPTPTNDNHALIDFTTSGAGTANAVVMQTANNNLPLSGTQKRFLTMSVDVAEAYCSNGPSGNAKLSFYLETADGETPLQAQPVQPCNSSFTHPVVEPVSGAGNITYSVGTVPALGSTLTIPSNFGFKVVNSSTVSGGGGNDMAYDNFTLLDATPQLDVATSPGTSSTPATITYTITNTTDLADKKGWGFETTLPAGVTVAGTPTSTCGAANLSSVTAGSTSVAVTAGDIAQGVASCTITIPVTAVAEGTYTIPASSTSLTGVDAPDDTTITIPAALLPSTAVSGITTPQNQNITTPVSSIVKPQATTVDQTSVTKVTDPTNGSIAIDQTTGAVTYVPNPGYSGPDSYTVNVCDTATPKHCTNQTIPVTVGVNSLSISLVPLTTYAVTPSTYDVQNQVHSASGQGLAVPVVAVQPKAIVGGASAGTAVVNPDGTITYMPAAGFSGKAAYNVKACDTSYPTPVCITTSVNYTVLNVFTPHEVSTPQNTPVTSTLASQVTVAGKPLKPTGVTQVTAPTHGAIAIDASTGAVTYVPDAGYSGVDSYVIKVCDNSTPSSQCANVTIPVLVGANMVTTQDLSTTTSVGVAVTTDVEASASTATGQALNTTPTVVTSPSNGTAIANSDGTITYTPAAGFSGADSYTYQLCDTSNPTPACSTSTVSVTVKNVFTPGPGVTTPQNQLVGTPLSSVASTSGKPLNPAQVTSVTYPAHGSISIDPTSGEVAYVPTPGYSGPDSYVVNVCDTSSPVQCADITVPVTVQPNTVTAVNDTVATAAGSAVTTDVRSNDTSASGQSFANPTVTSTPGHGTATVNSDGTITYTPAAGFSGADSYVYKVCDTSTPTPVCDAATVDVQVDNVFTPGTASTSGVTTPQNQSVGTPLSSIASTSGTPLDPTKATSVTDPSHGSISIDPTTGEVTYTPTPGYSGPDSYTIKVCDTATPVQCSNVTVSVTVDANTVTAKGDSATTSAGTPITTDVRGNDLSASGQAFANPTVTSGPAHGTTVVNPNGTITYTPDAGFSGADSYTYQVCDTSTPTPVCDTATVNVTVDNVFTPGSGIGTPQNQSITTSLTDVASTTGKALDPTKVTSAIAPSHGSISIDPTTGTVTYTPDAGYSGPDSYVVNVCDTSSPVQCADITVPVTVSPNSVAAANDNVTTSVGTGVTTDVRGNDTSASHQPLANPVVTSAPAHGTATANPDGTITYTPNAGFSGADSYQYEACDTSYPTPVCATATVNVTVTNGFTPGPVTGPSPVKTPQNKAITTPITDIVTTTGAPLDPTSVTEVTPPAHGKITIDPVTGTVSYTPKPGYSGPDSYTVNVCDTSVPKQCHNEVIKVVVGPNVITGPNPVVTTGSGKPTTINVLAGLTSKSGQKLGKPTISGKPKHGTVKVNPNGTITYTPAKGSSGKDTFKYTVCDTGTPKVCVIKTATVHVKGAVVVPSLPDTGGPSLKWLLGGGAALLTGFTLMITSRRRKA